MLSSSSSYCLALLGVLAGVSHGAAIEVKNETAPYGYPDPSTQQLMQIAMAAGGKLPNSPLPTSITNATATAFQLIAFNEEFETAFFTSLINNITRNYTGYEVGDMTMPVLTVLRAVQAQEESHALAALSVLTTANRFAPSPCNYTFSTGRFIEAIGLIETVTAVVLGALQDANVILAQSNATDLVRIISSVIGQEGEQNGYYRMIENKIPPESPFLTTVPAAFAWSALQMFVVPDSCPFNLSEIALPIFPPIMTNGGPIASVQPRNQTLHFVADLTTTPIYSNAGAMFNPANGGNASALHMTYTTGQQVPFSVPLMNATWNGSVISFSAIYPYDKYVMAGFSHGALTVDGNFSSTDAVVNHTLAGPAVIQAINKL